MRTAIGVILLVALPLPFFAPAQTITITGAGLTDCDAGRCHDKSLGDGDCPPVFGSAPPCNLDGEEAHRVACALPTAGVCHDALDVCPGVPGGCWVANLGLFDGNGDSYAITTPAGQPRALVLAWPAVLPFDLLGPPTMCVYGPDGMPQRIPPGQPKPIGPFPEDQVLVLAVIRLGQQPCPMPPSQPVPQCRDGYDNDGDQKVDWPEDPGCADPDDPDESDPTGGGQSVMVLDLGGRAFEGPALASTHGSCYPTCQALEPGAYAFAVS